MADTQIYYLFKRVALRFSIFIGSLALLKKKISCCCMPTL